MAGAATEERLEARDVVVIGASAGGINALLAILRELPADFPASVLIALHMAPGYPSKLPELLSVPGGMPVCHPVDGERLQRGRIYIAPPDNHIALRGGYIGVTRGPKENGHRPSIDLLFRSAAGSYGPRVISVVLTGNLDCGTAGSIAVKAHGGYALAQDPEGADYPDMPTNAIRHAPIDQVVSLSRLGPALVRIVGEAVQATAFSTHVPPSLDRRTGERWAPLVCPVCQGVLTENHVGYYEEFRCHVGHAFTFRGVIAEQAESLERALWAAVRALRETASITRRAAERARGELKKRLEEKLDEQTRQAEVIREILLSPGRISSEDARAIELPDPPS